MSRALVADMLSLRFIRQKLPDDVNVGAYIFNGSLVSLPLHCISRHHLLFAPRLLGIQSAVMYL